MELSATILGRVLAASRAFGWLLAAGVIFGVPIGVLELRARIIDHQAIGRVSARAFIDKVVECRRRTPRPHPSWQECEQRVRSHE